MTTSAILVCLAALLALTFWRPLGKLRRVLGVAQLLSTGHVFLVVGFLAGHAFGTGGGTLAHSLGPIVAFVAGWVGFATGMRFDWRVLKTVPVRAFAVALSPAFAAAMAVGAAVAAVLLAVGTDPAESMAAALVTAAAAATSAPTLPALVRQRRAGRFAEARAALRAIEFSAGFSDALAIVLACLAFALFRPVSGETMEPLLLVAVVFAGGLTIGLATWLFLGGKSAEDERLLLGLAMLALVAGFGGWLYFSPAAVAAIAAFVVVNLPGSRAATLIAAIRRVERPAVVTLMAVIGFYCAGPLTWLVLPVAGAMTVVRALAARAGGALHHGPIAGTPGLATPPGWTLGLAPQGIFGLMVVLSFFHVWNGDVGRSVLAGVALAALINEAVAPTLLVRALRRSVERKDDAP